MMKVQLTICGIDKGLIEVGDNSICGLLARGLFQEGMSKICLLQNEIKAIAAESEPSGERTPSTHGRRAGGDVAQKSLPAPLINYTTSVENG